MDEKNPLPYSERLAREELRDRASAQAFGWLLVIILVAAGLAKAAGAW